MENFTDKKKLKNSNIVDVKYKKTSLTQTKNNQIKKKTLSSKTSLSSACKNSDSII